MNNPTDELRNVQKQKVTLYTLAPEKINLEKGAEQMQYLKIYFSISLLCDTIKRFTPV